MTLFDTNVLIYAINTDSPFHHWAETLIVGEASNGGAAVNAISLAEICVGAADPHVVISDVLEWGVELFDVPTEAAVECATAYRVYRERRLQKSGTTAPDVPLPDFFIGAHAAVMGWEIATADPGRFKTYFPDVPLRLPE